MRYPAATWRGPVPNQGGLFPALPKLGVLHIMEGTLAGTDAWFHNAQSQVSAHFGVGKDGTVYQWVDTAFIAWHAASYNVEAIGVEHEGHTGDSLTPAQLHADAALMDWLELTTAIPLAASTSTGWCGHGQLGVAGGNHPDCPGAPILAQLPGLLLQAAGASPLPPETDAMDNITFVTFLYRFLLYRAPDPGGLALWVGELDKGRARADLWATFQNGPEGVACLNAQRHSMGLSAVTAP